MKHHHTGQVMRNTPWKPGDPHPLDNITMTRDCWPSTGWYIKAKDNTGVDWYSIPNSIFNALQGSLPTIKINLNTSEDSNYTIDAVMTILDGKADMQPAQFGVTHSRFQYVDFSYPIDFATVKVGPILFKM